MREVFIYQGEPLELRPALTDHVRERVASLRAMLFPESGNVFIRMWRRLRGVPPRVSANRALFSVAGHLAPPSILRQCSDSLSNILNRDSAQTNQDRLDVLTLSRPLADGPQQGPIDLASLTTQRPRVEEDLMALMDRRRGVVRPREGDLFGHDDLGQERNPVGLY